MAKKKSKGLENKGIFIGAGITLAIVIPFMVYVLPNISINIVSAQEPLEIPFVDDVDTTNPDTGIVDEFTDEELAQVIPDDPQPPDYEMDDIIDPMVLPPISSNDTINEQIKDEIFSDTVILDAFTFITDTQGNRTESSTNIDVPLLSFFVEDISNRDFSDGIIQTMLVLRTEPLATVQGSGTFQIFIGNQTVLNQPLSLVIDGVADQNGLLPVVFQNELGMTSEDFTFSFLDHVDKFPIQGLSNVDYKVDFNVISGEREFNVANSTIYKAVIATDPNQIIIIDQEGGLIRAYPVDDKITLYNNGQRTTRTQCSSATGGRCSGYTTRCTAEATEALGTMTLRDTEGNVLLEVVATGSGCNNAISGNVLVERNQEYTIQLQSINADVASGTFTFMTPESQKNFSFGCTTKFTSPRIPICNFPS